MVISRPPYLCPGAKLLLRERQNNWPLVLCEWAFGPIHSGGAGRPCRGNDTIASYFLMLRGWSCTSSLRINLPGSPVDRHQGKKVYARRLSWPPSGPLIRGDAHAAGCVDARRLLRPPPRAVSSHPACSYPHWLRPRWHAEKQHLAQRPDMIRQSRGHGGRPRLPALGRACAVCRRRQSEGYPQAGMR
jgi:hypothetical protein